MELPVKFFEIVIPNVESPGSNWLVDAVPKKTGTIATPAIVVPAPIIVLR